MDANKKRWRKYSNVARNDRYKLFPKFRKQPFIQSLASTPLSNLHTLQTQSISIDEERKSETSIQESEQVNDHYLQATLVSLAASTAGVLISPLFSLAAIPGLLYLSWPLLKESYGALAEERRFKAVHVNTTIAMGLLVTRQFFACALTYSFLMLARQLLRKVEDHSLKKATDLFGDQARFVWLLTNGMEIQIPIEQVQVGDVIVVNAGGMIPVDGSICHGMASIDQRMLTGEAQPVEKEVGDSVLAATIVLSGQIHIQVEKAGSETVAAQITTVLNQTIDYKEQLHWQWMEWIDDSAWITLLAGLFSFPFIGFTGAITLIYAAGFGYTMRIVAPITLMSYLNRTSEQRILIKDGRSLEALKEVDTVVFDKTGTLTEEIPTLTKLLPVNGYSETELLTYVAAAEYKQTHPIALAILGEANKRGLRLPEIKDADYQIGYGLTVQIDDKTIRVGSMRFMDMERIPISPEVQQRQSESDEAGNSLVYVAINEQMAGAIELMPTVRPEAKGIIDKLRRRGMSLVIISGDQTKPTQSLAATLGIDHYFAETLPENKATLIKELQAEGRTVCFIGDGINDSIALKTANLSISLSGATNVAMDSAQILLMDGTLNQLDTLFDIAHDFDQNIKNGFALSLLPTILSVAGIFVFQIGIVTSVLLYYGGLALGIKNAMQPMLEAPHEKLEVASNSLYGNMNNFNGDGRTWKQRSKASNSRKMPLRSRLFRSRSSKIRLVDTISR